MSTHNKEAAEPLPCPHCGSDDIHYPRDEPTYCNQCEATALNVNYWNRRAALTASEAPATEQAPTLPTPSWARDMHGETEVVTMDEVRERDAMWMAKIAALRSEQAPAGEVPSDLRKVIAFLLGEADLQGIWFGDKPHRESGEYWWRTHLRAALSTPPAVPPGHLIVPVEPMPKEG